MNQNDERLQQQTFSCFSDCSTDDDIDDLEKAEDRNSDESYEEIEIVIPIEEELKPEGNPAKRSPDFYDGKSIFLWK